MEGCSSCWDGSRSNPSVCPQNDSVLRQQLQEEARELRSLYQEKVVPQQSLVVGLEGVWGRRERRGEERAVKGGRGWPHSPFPASKSLPVITLIPPQAKLNLSVRALASSAPNLQVANGSGRPGQNRWAVEENRRAGCFEISVSHWRGKGEQERGQIIEDLFFFFWLLGPRACPSSIKVMCGIL